MYFKTLVAMASATFALVACGGGGSGGLGGGAGAGATATPVPGGTGSPTAVPTGSAGYFITGTVNGSVKNGTKDVSGSFVDGGPNHATLVANTTDALTVSWSIQNVKRVVGTYNCNTAGNLLVINLTDPSKGPLETLSASTTPGSCSVTVTSATANEIEGTFTATLKALASPTTFTVTNGSFKVGRSSPV